MARKILLISYQFCPKGQIGTRRWSKFAKYLSSNGYTVHILSAEYPYEDTINWCHEVVNNPQIHIHRIPGRYPAYLRQAKRNFWIKLFDRIAARTFYQLDYAQHWGGVMIKAAQQIIQHEGIDQVIVTGAPFTTFHHSARLKEKVPNIKLLLDYRDPWTTLMSDSNWFDKRLKNKAIQMETYAFKQADQVWFTTQQFRREYAQAYPKYQHKFKVLYNGFDEQDFRAVEPLNPRPLSIVYAGSLSQVRMQAIVAIIEALSESVDEFLHQHLHIHLYGFNYIVPAFTNPTLEQLYHKHVTYHGVVSQKEVFRVLNSYDICLSINAKGHEHLIGAKTFDYMGLNKKILLITRPGELAQILLQKGQYVANYDTREIILALTEIKKSYGMDGKKQQPTKSYDEFNYHTLTKQLLTYLATKY